MHPLLQLGRKLLDIGPDARQLHSEEDARLPTRGDDALGAGAADLVVGVEGVGELLGGWRGGGVGEKVREDEGVFEGLACALALIGGGGVGGIAEQGDAALGEGGR